MARRENGLTEQEYAKWRNLNAKVYTYRARGTPILDETLLEIKEWQIAYEKLNARIKYIMRGIK